jgi:hypothetical protein
VKYESLIYGPQVYPKEMFVLVKTVERMFRMKELSQKVSEAYVFKILV